MYLWCNITNVEEKDANSLFVLYEFIIFFTVINFFIPNRFEKYIFIPSSALTGSILIINSLHCIIEADESNDSNIDNKTKKEPFITSLILQCIIIIISICFQIFYIKIKIGENPSYKINQERENSLENKNKSSSNSIQKVTDSSKELQNKSNLNQTKSSVNSEEEEEINDQDD